MKFVFILTLLLQMSWLDNQPAVPITDINQLRRTYLKAVDNAKINDSLLSRLEQNEGKSALLLGYQGACEGLRAKHAFNPYKKLDYLSKSQQTLAKAITQEPNNVEIRFLRFSMQHYLPTFLGHSKHLTEDRLAIVQNIRTEENQKLGIQTLQLIAKFLIDSKRCEENELQVLREVMK